MRPGKAGGRLRRLTKWTLSAILGGVGRGIRRGTRGESGSRVSGGNWAGFGTFRKGF
jgi:hypothetical protein